MSALILQLVVAIQNNRSGGYRKLKKVVFNESVSPILQRLTCCSWNDLQKYRGFARQPCCMAGTMKVFCIRKNICSHRKKNLLFLLCKTSILGPFLESPETLRAIFGCHNSLCISRTEGFKSSNFTFSLLLVTLKIGWQIHKWLSGPEKFSGLSRNGPLAREMANRINNYHPIRKVVLLAKLDWFAILLMTYTE